MNLSIFDVDGIGSKTIDKNEIKTFIKNCGYGIMPRLEVEVGTSSKELCDNDAVTVFKLSDIFSGTNWTIDADDDNHVLELTFKGYESCNAFLQALEFAVSVLKEAKARAEHQEEEAF